MAQMFQRLSDRFTVDVLATLASQVKNRLLYYVILSVKQLLHQLQEIHTSIFVSHKNDFRCSIEI